MIIGCLMHPYIQASNVWLPSMSSARYYVLSNSEQSGHVSVLLECEGRDTAEVNTGVYDMFMNCDICYEGKGQDTENKKDGEGRLGLGGRGRACLRKQAFMQLPDVPLQEEKDGVFQAVKVGPEALRCSPALMIH